MICLTCLSALQGLQQGSNTARSGQLSLIATCGCAGRVSSPDPRPNFLHQLCLLGIMQSVGLVPSAPKKKTLVLTLLSSSFCVNCFQGVS